MYLSRRGFFRCPLATNVRPHLIPGYRFILPKRIGAGCTICLWEFAGNTFQPPTTLVGAALLVDS